MKRYGLVICLLAFSTVALAQSKFVRKEVNATLTSWGFSAPSVTGIGSLTPNANVGDIAIDRSASPGVFYGWNGSNWVNFGSSAGNLVVRPVTTTDSASNTDDVLILSGSSFTETLFSAVGNTGKVLRIVSNGTSLTNVYTLNTTGGQTIGGVASGSYALYTNGESLTIISDGANWQIQDHKTKTMPAVYSATFTGFGTVSTQNLL